ncbi:hypothetical protein MGYG_05230 [Nannizzia gypsea CBS 118893]|uniref:Uncharacterized protein n=1 Tax=Arthroderma gypseum (strain ATCC MYA-4604 / CBS 118893) TaxID=535722 RepID=E4UVA0_ARTGP|nr:hypothetical protein MGYG_05230 [Nannizzia gypsea CBS 118893]EFR02227.1 hypothetical protein MGYG_05230 [Nannizzia gypsea CBS 118893]
MAAESLIPTSNAHDIALTTMLRLSNASSNSLAISSPLCCLGYGEEDPAPTRPKAFHLILGLCAVQAACDLKAEISVLFSFTESSATDLNCQSAHSRNEDAKDATHQGEAEKLFNRAFTAHHVQYCQHEPQGCGVHPSHHQLGREEMSHSEIKCPVLNIINTQEKVTAQDST